MTVLGSGLSATAETIAPRKNASAPTPRTTATAAAALTQSPPAPKPAANKVEILEKRVAQVDVDPGQATAGGSSYIGIGGNIGLDGDTALGDTNFTVISKIGLTQNLSLRPAAVFGDNTVFQIPLTYDFNLRSTEAFDESLSIAPYLGVGVAFSTGVEDDDEVDVFEDDDDDDADVSPMITGGVDFPLSDRFTATAAVNAAFFDDTDIGLVLGVGYNFF
ncbi:hypothetical protein B7486_47955 [cyanobacterium TDX16]|nr:hypothetical protein B7486_47955 [cyanobacterium TDX16]